jgi:hypothetical protein
MCFFLIHKVYELFSLTHQFIVKYSYTQGYMFQLRRAIIRPLPRTDPKSLQCWNIIAYGVWLS